MFDKVLKGKPKLFIIQACRGNLRPENKAKNLISNTDGVSHSNILIKNEVDETDSNNIIVKRQDFFIWYAAVDGYKALRNPNDGCVFLKCLVFVTAKTAYKNDIFRIFVEVNDLMKTYNSEIENPGLSTLYTTATRNFFFKNAKIHKHFRII